MDTFWLKGKTSADHLSYKHGQGKNLYYDSAQQSAWKASVLQTYCFKYIVTGEINNS